MNVIKKAWNLFHRQRNRCYNKNSKDYKYYGGEGVKVRYSLQEFTGWFEENIQKFTGSSVTVGRIDHKKDYTLCNIEIQSQSNNTKERNSRHGNPKQKLTKEQVVEIKRLLETPIYQKDIAQKFGVSGPTISMIHTGKVWKDV